VNLVASPRDELRRIPLAQLRHSISSPRTDHDPAALKRLTHWMRRRGLLHPILVRPLARGEFEVVAGERRLIAARELGWLEIECRVRSYPDPADDHESLGDTYALEDALIENLVRENLGKLEESEAILDLVCLHIGAARGFVLERLGAMRYRARKGHNVVTSLEEDEQILETFAALNLIGWQAFYTHRLPLLELPEDVKGLIQTRSVNYAVAKRIAKLEQKEKARIIERIHAGLRGRDLKRELDGIQHKSVKPEVWNRLERIRNALTNKALEPRISALLTSLEQELGLT
jgi:ParB family transcriptional regulator, chromosome partitioning protein